MIGNINISLGDRPVDKDQINRTNRILRSAIRGRKLSNVRSPRVRRSTPKSKLSNK